MHTMIPNALFIILHLYLSACTTTTAVIVAVVTATAAAPLSYRVRIRTIRAQSSRGHFKIRSIDRAPTNWSRSIRYVGLVARPHCTCHPRKCDFQMVQNGSNIHIKYLQNMSRCVHTIYLYIIYINCLLVFY